MSSSNPVKSSERHIILDVLRGIAILGICLANFQEFSLYSFQTKEVAVNKLTDFSTYYINIKKRQ